MTREEAITYLKVIWNRYKAEYVIERETLDAYHVAIEALSNKPTDEWCTDCKEYDHEKHCCPRFNRVIRTTLDEALANLKEEFESAEYEDYEHATLVDIKEPLKVLVVRCKDCRHRDLFSCPLADNDFQKDEDYCSWGERRKDGDDE